MVSDPVADFLTRLRNGLMAKKPEVGTNCSKMVRRVAEILERCGYIENIRVEARGAKKTMRIGLRYDRSGKPIAEGFKRVSRPGLRAYFGAKDIPHVRGGLGISIVSTPQGILTGYEAQKRNIGGELLCFVW